MGDYGWMLDAKCRNMDPKLFDSDDPTPAAVLCGGCAVMIECAQFHVEPINVTEYVERLTGQALNEPADTVHVSGVKAMGMQF